MERMHRVGLAVILAAAVALSATYLLFVGTIGPPPTCPLELRLVTIDTGNGWFYVVVDVQAPARPLSEYNVTFYHWVNVSGGDQERAVDYLGPLLGLVGASGNFSFKDAGGAPDYLDPTGDYFRTSTWYDLEIVRSGEIVGGTLGCI